MSDVSGGEGAALNASVEFDKIVEELTRDDLVRDAREQVARLEEKVDREREHLVGVEQSLATALAALAALEGA